MVATTSGTSARSSGVGGVVGYPHQPAVDGLVSDDARYGAEPVADVLRQVGGGQVEEGADVRQGCLLVTGAGRVRRSATGTGFAAAAGGSGPAQAMRVVR